MDYTIILILAVLFVALVLLVLMSITRRGKHGLDQEKYRIEWMKIENSLDRNNMMTYQMAIMNADKLLDNALRDIGLDGDSMGDRLKIAGKKFSDVNQVWAAHKLRNRIVHETDIQIKLMTAKKALYIYKKSLKELGAI